MIVVVCAGINQEMLATITLFLQYIVFKPNGGSAKILNS